MLSPFVILNEAKAVADVEKVAGHSNRMLGRRLGFPRLKCSSNLELRSP
jgi:hypothetical protein